MSTPICEIITESSILQLQAVQLKNNIRKELGKNPRFYRKAETIVDKIDILVEDLKQESLKEE